MVSKEYLCIPKEYEKLTIALSTAYANELSLDKEKTSYSDSLDALRLASKMYKMKWLVSSLFRSIQSSLEVSHPKSLSPLFIQLS